jgi:nicotinate (nicotinamide) nucleotide adenylyltransferase
LTALAKKVEDTELYLIIGADNLIKFELWENIDEILKHKVIVLGRDDIDMEEQIKKFTEEQQTHFVLVKDFPEVDVSSTTVRKKLEACKTSDLSNELEDDVLKYILDNKLYCSQI